MPRIRTIKPDFFHDEDIPELSHQARLLYLGLWCYADKEGRLENRPQYLKAQIFPYEKADVEKMLSELEKPKKRTNKPFIIRYSHQNNEFIQILEFKKHQNTHHTERESEIPEPEIVTENNGYLTVKGALNNGERLVGKEGKGKEGKGSIITKQRFLEFVLLTTEEFEKLTSRLGADRTQDLIDRLNSYIGSTGRKYHSHYHTILGWARREKPSDKGGSDVRRVLT